MENVADLWQVARRMLMENTCKQVIERHFLRPLADLFSPEIVATYTDRELSHVAAVSEQALAKRKHLLELYRGFLESLSKLNHI